MTSINHSQNQYQYQDIEHIAILKNKIAILDRYIYSHTKLKVIKIWGTWNFCSSEPHIHISSQLQYALLLEEELDKELSKPVDPHKLRRDESTSINVCKHSEKSFIKHLKEKILEIDDIMNSNNCDPEKCLTEENAFAYYTNTILIKQILMKRLKREQCKFPKSTTTTRDEAYVNYLQRNIAILEACYSEKAKKAFIKKRQNAIIQSNYYLTAIQYQKDQLKLELAKPYCL